MAYCAIVAPAAFGLPSARSSVLPGGAGCFNSLIVRSMHNSSLPATAIGSTRSQWIQDEFMSEAK